MVEIKKILVEISFNSLFHRDLLQNTKKPTQISGITRSITIAMCSTCCKPSCQSSFLSTPIFNWPSAVKKDVPAGLIWPFGRFTQQKNAQTLGTSSMTRIFFLNKIGRFPNIHDLSRWIDHSLSSQTCWFPWLRKTLIF